MIHHYVFGLSQRVGQSVHHLSLATHFLTRCTYAVGFFAATANTYWTKADVAMGSGVMSNFRMVVRDCDDENLRDDDTCTCL